MNVLNYYFGKEFKSITKLISPNRILEYQKN